MVLFLILALIIAILAVMFALQNTATITVAFFLWKYDGSLALILLLTLGLGVIISLLVSMPAMIRKSLIISNQKRVIERLEKNTKDNAEGSEPSSPE